MSADAAPASSGWGGGTARGGGGGGPRSTGGGGRAQGERREQHGAQEALRHAPPNARRCSNLWLACRAEQLDLGQLHAIVLGQIGDPDQVVAVGLAGRVEVDRSR